VPPRTILAITIALLAVSSSPPLIAYAAAPALAIAFWRNALAVGVIGPVAVTRKRMEIRALGRRSLSWCALAGVALAVHFGTWIPSAKLTSVAMATALVATQPVWQGLIAGLQGQRLPAVTWVGIAIAVLGAVLATGVDLTHANSRAVLGDLLALAGGVAAAVYTAFGEKVRAVASTTTYTTICYSVCALLLGVVCLVSGTPLTGFDGRTWLVIGAITAGAQLLGHTLFNYTLEHVSATTVSVLVLLEVPIAGLIAWVWLGQVPRAAALPGLTMLVAGVLVVILGGVRKGRRAAREPVVAAGGHR
jgi:drug/metabolite transporter (DMT)-like permease